MSRACIECGAPITRHSTGRCRPCGARLVSSNPEVVAARGRKISATFADPAVKASHAAACSKAKRRTMADPAVVERMREAGRSVGAKNFWAANTKEARSRAVESIRRKHLAWCPEEFWPLNQTLKRRGLRLPARQAEIAAIIEKRSRTGLSADRAADFVRRYSPVYRCTDTGRQQIGGTHWRYGSTTLDRDGLIALALRKGWQPDSWKALAA